MAGTEVSRLGAVVPRIRLIVVLKQNSVTDMRLILRKNGQDFVTNSVWTMDRNE